MADAKPSRKEPVPDAHQLILGTRWGDVWPERTVNQKNNSGEDVRTLVLRVLRRYISELTFYRRDEECEPPIPFKVPANAIYIGFPDNDQDLVLPSIVFTHGEEAYNGFGFQPQVLEWSRDVFQRGTVLLHQYTQEEDFIIEAWSAKKPERRAIVSGLQTAFMVSDQYYGLRFRVPDYFNQPVMFTVMSTNRPDLDAIRGRRQAMMKVSYRVEVVQLVPYVNLEPQVSVNVFAEDDPLVQTCGELQAEGVTQGDPPRPNPPNGWSPVPYLPPNQSRWFNSPWLAKWFPFKLLPTRRRHPRPPGY